MGRCCTAHALTLSYPFCCVWLSPVQVYVLGSQTYVTARPSLGETVLEPNHAVQQLPRISCVSVFSKQQQHKHNMQKPQVAPVAVSAPAPSAAAAGASVGQHGAHQATAQQRAAQHTRLQQQQQQAKQQQQPSAASAAVAAESVWQPPSSIVAPPAWLTSALAATLRQELGMQLFNFDLIVPEQQPVFDGPQQQQQPQGDDPDAAPALCYVVDINFFPGVDKIPDFEQRFVNFLLAAAEGGPNGPDCAVQRYQQQVQQQAAAAAAAAQEAAVAGQQAAGLRSPTQPGDANSGGSDGGSGSGSCPPQHRSSIGGAEGYTTDSGARCSSFSSSGGCGASSAGGCSRRLQHSLSADKATAGAAAAAAGASGQHGRRLSGAGSGSSRQWGDLSGCVLGSSPPPQLQVAGCS